MKTLTASKMIAALLLGAGLSMAQVVIPDGTPIRVRLQTNLSSETAELGETVDFSVTQEVRVGDSIVVSNGARATGSITELERRGHMGKAGKLAFSIERVQAVDGSWLNLRYTPQKNHGKGGGVKAGIITGAIAVVFWPAAPLGLLAKGHDVEVIKGRTYDVFTDESSYLAQAAPANMPQTARALPGAPTQVLRMNNGAIAENAGLNTSIAVPRNAVQISNTSYTNAPNMSNVDTFVPAAPQQMIAAPAAPAMATLNITASTPGADIEIDGMFVGNAPATIQIPVGTHHVAVKAAGMSWEKDLQTYGGNVPLTATLGKAPVVTAKK